MTDTIRFIRPGERREPSPNRTAAAPSTQPSLPPGHPRSGVPAGWRGFLLGLVAAIIGLSLFCGCKSVGLPEPLRAGSDVSRDRKKRNEEAVRRFEENRNEAEFQAALNRYAHGDVRGCEQTLRRLLERAPKHRESRLLLAELCVAENRLDEAAEAAAAALADWPDDAPTHYTVGLVLDARGRTAEALAHYERATRIDPDNELYAVAYELAAESLRASAEGRRPALDGDAGHGAAGVVPAGFVAATPGESPGREAVRGDTPRRDVPGAPSEPCNRNDSRIADAAGSCGSCDAGPSPPAGPARPDPAMGTADGPFAAGQTGSNDPALARGESALRAGSFDEALAWFEEAIRRRPDDPSMPVAAAVAALKANQPDMAVELLEPAQSRFPGDAPIKRVLAVARYRLGDYASSELLLQQALSLDNTDALSYFFLGCTLERLGRSEEAQRQFAEARAIEARRRAAL